MMHAFKRFFPLFIFALLITTQLHAHSSPLLNVEVYNVKSTLNIVYNTKTGMKMDMYQPATKGENNPDELKLKPALIFLHGAGGNKKGSSHITKRYTTAGYVTFAINYGKKRAIGLRGVNPADGINDKEKIKIEKAVATVQNWRQNIASCVKWVRDHHQEYGINPNWVILAGGSQGAFMSVNTAYDKKLFEDTPVNVVMSLWGGSLTSSFYGTMFHDYMKDTTYTIPLLIAHGDKDGVTEYSGSELLQKQAENHGIKTHFIKIIDARHPGEKPGPSSLKEFMFGKNHTNADGSPLESTPIEESLKFFDQQLQLTKNQH